MAMELLTEQQLAEYLQVNRRTVQTWRMRGVGPDWTKVGKKVRYCMPDVQEYLQRGKRRTVAEASRQEHHGWTNRSTWLTYRWITSDDDVYAAARKAVRASGAAGLQRHISKSVLGEVPAKGLARDLLFEALDTIDWGDITQALVEGYEA